MDQIRATLAELMGKYEQKEDLDSTKPFTDPDVCRQYLTGICPHDLFENTKFYMGECSRIHSEKLRERYQNERKNHFYGYELETLKIIQPMIDDCDKKIARGKARVEEDLVRRKTLDPMIIEEAKKIDSQIQSRMARADELGRNGEVEESFKIVEEVELLKRTKLEMLEKGGDASYQSRLKPCDVCGALLSATDSDRRLTEHYSGKIHVGFQKLRDMSKTLSAYIQENRHRLNGRGRNGSREYLSERRTRKVLGVSLRGAIAVTGIEAMPIKVIAESGKTIEKGREAGPDPYQDQDRDRVLDQDLGIANTGDLVN
ncbi:uncharacterized protein TA13605 [Theileria annulata]|uniref:Uncharacterized protein n=1 Tax=Theileria annulata TaxID=5874 RepID=Q4UEL9_THEAN|nr:uncharacterized protein TA13605 [Theileria annulata]CAI74470.1 hypothetical protein, conserved [Theileria annulata]|eukprot:XP_952202.1 hypothetical protein, conserved [Theileria annulata]